MSKVVCGAVPCSLLELHIFQCFLEFIAPVFIGDKVNFYTEVDRVGNTSISIHIEAVAERYSNGEQQKVAEADFVYVRLAQQ